MKYRYIGILLSLFFCSCGPVKIKDFEKDYTQDLVGKLKSMNITKYEYKFLKKDTINLVKNTFLNFDSNNNVINEKITTEDNQTEYSFKYQNSLLIEKKLVSDKNNFLTIYTYDKNTNLIEERELNDEGIYYLKSQEFDEYHNIVERKSNFAHKIKVATKIEYDYKKRSFISKTTLDTLRSNTVVSKKDFNKKGFVIKTILMNSTLNDKYYTYEIDKKGNLTKKTFYKSDDSIIETVTFKNTYDKKGNIIKRERFLNGKLIEKTTYEIIYY